MDTELPPIVNDASVSVLPFELVQSLNQTYFLHLLLTEPTKVIPPGKSLLSMMQHVNFKVPGEPKKSDADEEILDRVKNVAHRAFWDEALEVLSTPLPSMQMPRLQRLYADIHDALSPLFPSSHPILVTLLAPVPPTSSPLHSAIYLLKDIVQAMHLRCAPVRDAEVQHILLSLSDPPFSYPLPHDADVSATAALAEFIIDEIKAVIDVAEDMKADLNSFILGTMSETELQGVLFRVAKEQERDMVVKLWGGKELVRDNWRSWIKEFMNSRDTSTDSWISRLLTVLTSDSAVYCPIPQQDQPSPETETAMNRLPPQLFYFEPMLRSMQDHMQAMVIVAVLRSLLPRPSKPVESTADTQEQSKFMQRVWALLKEELDTNVKTNEPDSSTPLRLVNLADEVVREYDIISNKIRGHSDPEAALRLRNMVERLLRPDDLVYVVLKRRLTSALETGLLSLSTRDHEADSHRTSSVVDFSRRGHSNGSVVPARMQTGRALPGTRGFASKKIKLDLEHPEGYPFRVVDGNSMKTPQGFEDPVLQEPLTDLYKKLSKVVEWTETVWGDLV